MMNIGGMNILHTADVLGHSVRFFRSPLPGEDLPWHAVDDLHRAMGLPRALRQSHQARMRQQWGRDIRLVECSGRPLMIGPHWMGQGMTGGYDNVADGGADEDASGPMFIAYCKAAREANDVLLLMLGATPAEGLSRTMRAIMRTEGDGHVH